MYVLIPALEPGPRLPRLVDELLSVDPDLDVLVIDDGSGPGYDDLFSVVEDAGARVLRHPHNRGKGAALKTGFAEIARWAPEADVVTADADGQHRVDDILEVGRALRVDAAAGTSALILGCRDFGGDVPLRSRVGNAVSRGVFRLTAGWSLSDTQTGLRGLPAALLPWALSLPGDRFEYEQNMLLRSRSAGVLAREIPIETVYLEQNASSHFRPLVDSIRVMLPVALFAGSSLLAFFLDTALLLLLSATTGSLVVSIVAARIVSASVNFFVNRRLVFHRRGRGRGREAMRYGVLAVVLLASNIVWMDALTGVGIPLLAAKLITEAVLFLTSYGVQRSVVFRRSATAAAPAPAGASRSAAVETVAAGRG
ncbi:bifunctional glycosyltransferase family 2/GtrA family protein [Microbacterium sp. SSW1-59]|uniref:bifunctional glycosyltransferase family 2/GtrA family protein n=1 Tax=Microbacterium xanthum TaxID=3079794 RepID=UPI002AD2043C|nr:bifunctional glycosyltransferase family 2/GtrA family protein [Microbacterium sp. SSW1-59]MDZ8200404.1 bifunctional glycosyltransferase family 2/GtrA family protein [Microbacterium sp. SSW1-59]